MDMPENRPREPRRFDTPPKSRWGRKLTLAFLSVAMVAGFGSRLWQPGDETLVPPVTVTETITPPPVTPAPVVVAAPYVSEVAGIPDLSRSLTKGEAQLAQKLFGAELDTATLRLHFFGAERESTVSGVAKDDTKNIEIYGSRNTSSDYSADKDVFNYGTFVYELAQLWQSGQGERLWAGRAEGHEYTLKEDADFINYGSAQQRAMVEDYALRFFHPSHATRWLPKTHKYDTQDTDKMLRGMVENQFPAAKAARLALRETYARQMTAGEAELVRAFFGFELNPAQVKLYMYPFAVRGAVASVEGGYGANFWGATQHDADYSNTKTASHLATFMHEITHVWQFQTGQRHTPNQTQRQYRYWLDTKSTYTDFSIEQQAAMVEDYVMYFLHPSKDMTYMPQTYNESQFAEKTGVLKKVVEAQFPGAKELREKYEGKKTVPKIALQQPQRLAPAFT